MAWTFPPQVTQMDKLTRQQGAVLGAFTGILCGEMSDLHEYIEKIMGRPVWTHEMGQQSIADEIKEKARPDFLALIAQERRQ